MTRAAVTVLAQSRYELGNAGVVASLTPWVGGGLGWDLRCAGTSEAARAYEPSGGADETADENAS